MKSILLPSGKPNFVLLNLIALLLVLTPCALRANDITLQGSLAYDDNVQLFDLTVAAPGPVDMRSYGYAGGTTSTGLGVPGGGFDTALTLFDGAGAFLTDNDDGSGVATDPMTGLAGDSRITLNLAVGSYVVALTQYDNFSVGLLSDGFFEDGNSYFTADPSFSPAGSCPGNLFRDSSGTTARCRTSTWTIEFLNVSTATERSLASVPEPGPFGLASAFFFMLTCSRRIAFSK